MNDKRKEENGNPDDERKTIPKQPDESRFWFFLDKIQRRLPCKNEWDIVFTTKIATLAMEGQISEAILFDCLDTLWLAKKRGPIHSEIGYFRKSIEKQLEKIQVDLNELLSKTLIPAFA